MTDSAVLYASGTGCQIDLTSKCDGLYLTVRANGKTFCIFTAYVDFDEQHDVLTALAEQLGV